MQRLKSQNRNHQRERKWQRCKESTFDTSCTGRLHQDLAHDHHSLFHQNCNWTTDYLIYRVTTCLRYEFSVINSKLRQLMSVGNGSLVVLQNCKKHMFFYFAFLNHVEAIKTWIWWRISVNTTRKQWRKAMQTEQEKYTGDGLWEWRIIKRMSNLLRGSTHISIRNCQSVDYHTHCHHDWDWVQTCRCSGFHGKDLSVRGGPSIMRTMPSQIQNVSNVSYLVGSMYSKPYFGADLIIEGCSKQQ